MSGTVIGNRPEELVAQQIQQLQKDVAALKANQSKRLVFPDNTTNRILIDGLNGAMKISLPGFDVTQALPSTELLFSTTFGSIVESHYRLSATVDSTNSTTFIYPSVFSASDPIRILVNLSDYKNILFYLEGNIEGTASAMAEVQLFNVTTSSAVTGSTIDSDVSTSMVRRRSGAITLASGSNEYSLKYRRVGGTGSDFVVLGEAHLVTRVTL